MMLYVSSIPKSLISLSSGCVRDLNGCSLDIRKFTVSLLYLQKQMYKSSLGVKWFFQDDFWMIHV